MTAIIENDLEPEIRVVTILIRIEIIIEGDPVQKKPPPIILILPPRIL